MLQGLLVLMYFQTSVHRIYISAAYCCLLLPMLHVLQRPRPTVSPTKEALEKRVPIYVDVADPMRSLEWNSKNESCPIHSLTFLPHWHLFKFWQFLEKGVDTGRWTISTLNLELVRLVRLLGRGRSSGWQVSGCRVHGPLQCWCLPRILRSRKGKGDLENWKHGHTGALLYT